MNLQKFASVTVAALLAATPAFSAQYALLVGINDYPGEDNDLHGCLTDSGKVDEFLTLKHGFPKENILVLRDAEATTAGIEKAFRAHLIDKVKPGDSVVFFYSGHGTQVPDLEDPDEDDDADEALCAYDMHPRKRETWLTDDRLRSWISQLKSERVLVLFDCCHAGTGTRGYRDAARIPGAKYMDLGFDRPERASRNFAISKAMRSPASGPNHTLLAACSSDEVARDGGARLGGIFTSYFLDEANRQGPGATLANLMTAVGTKVNAYVQQSGRPHDLQSPQLEGRRDVTLADYLSGKASAAFSQQEAADSQPGPGSSTATSAPSTAGPQPLAHPQNAFEITLHADKEIYEDGELMTCTVQSAKDGHLRLYYTDREQRTYMIFPNKYQPDSAIHGGTPIAVPGKGASFALKVFFPKGTVNQGQAPHVQEILSAVVSTIPFKDAGGDHWNESPFIEFASQPRRKVITRGIDVVRADAAITHFIYSVTPKK